MAVSKQGKQAGHDRLGHNFGDLSLWGGLPDARGGSFLWYAPVEGVPPRQPRTAFLRRRNGLNYSI